MWLVGYGSLMNPEQFEGKNYQLVYVKGWKRIFNKIVSRNTWKDYAENEYQGTLNVVKSSNCNFNAISYKLDSIADLNKLIQREQDYHLEKVRAHNLLTHQPLKNHYMFMSNTINSKGHNIISQDIKPIPRYLEVCRKGSYAWTKMFGNLFDRTTYLADGITSVKEYLQN